MYPKRKEDRERERVVHRYIDRKTLPSIDSHFTEGKRKRECVYHRYIQRKGKNSFYLFATYCLTIKFDLLTLAICNNKKRKGEKRKEKKEITLTICLAHRRSS